MTLTFAQAGVCALLTLVILGAYALGLTVGADRERKRTARFHHNIAKSRRAS